jgi:hypothetical protein
MQQDDAEWLLTDPKGDVHDSGLEFLLVATSGCTRAPAVTVSLAPQPDILILQSHRANKAGLK